MQARSRIELTAVLSKSTEENRIKAKSRDTVAATLQRLARNVRLVFDYLGMTENSRRRPRGRPATAG